MAIPIVIAKETEGEALARHPFHRQWLIAKTALEMGSKSEPIQLAIKDGLDRLRTFVAQCMPEGQTQGEITTRHNAEMLVDVRLNAWQGVLMRAQLNRDDRPIAAFLTVAMDELLKP